MAIANDRAFRVDGTLDIECADWDRFVLGAIYPHPRVFYDLDELIDTLVMRRGTYWAHAGGVYDFLAIIERLRRRGVTCRIDTAQHRISRVQFAGVTLRDSYALLPFPLDELVPMLGRSAASLPWACECGRSCGGYCKISEKARDGDPDLEDYCVADCRDLYEVLACVQTHAREHGLQLRGTIGSTAYASAKHALELPDANLPWEIWRRVKAADKGARIAVVRPRARGPGVEWDIVNAYPGALARAELPIGRHRELGGARAKAALARQRPGIYTARVRVPESLFPPLPWRIYGRTAYPFGEFAGVWPLPELQAAIDRGTEILDVSHAVIWEATAPIFAGLMSDWFAIRRAVGKDTPLGHWTSRVMKALTGKLAEQPDRERVVVNPEVEKIKWCPGTGRCRKGCTRRCGAYEQLDLFGAIWSAPYWKLPGNAHAHWSAYLRALVRVQWLEGAERYAPGELCYGDTDSLWVTETQSTPVPVGELLGQWELKRSWADLEILAPKSYAYREGSSGKLIYRGAPGISDEDWRRGHAVLDRGVMTLRQAVKGIDGLFKKRAPRHVAISGSQAEQVWYGDRKLDPDVGITYPCSAEDHRDRFKTGSPSQVETS